MNPFFIAAIASAIVGVVFESEKNKKVLTTESKANTVPTSDANIMPTEDDSENEQNSSTNHSDKSHGGDPV